MISFFVLYLLVYRLGYISPLGLAQYITCTTLACTAHIPNLTCTAHIPSLYKALFCTLFYTHQYTDYSVILFHFILLTWYQSHCSDLVVFSGVLPLPSPSPVAAVRSESPPSHPTTLSDLVYLSINSSNHRYDVIDKTSPIKTQPETIQKKLSRARTRRPKFLPVEDALHALPRAAAKPHVLPRASRAPTRLTRPVPLIATSALVRHRHVSITRHPVTSAY